MVQHNTPDAEPVTHLVTPLSVVINEAVEKGYDIIFRIKEDGSLWDQNGIYYDAEEMKIVYTRVFKNNPEDADGGGTTQLYLLRNEEGDKGILVDADGIYGDARIARFIRKMEQVQQRIAIMERQLKPANRWVIAAAGLLLLGSAVAFKITSRKR